ncbi:hypothetical protein MANES_18G017550v8 [Manihot esculenta]|uniref:Uncharacterized protein n=1 Tax=Manihot esculenta TaxID=3983 RepID=A0A2C9U0P7_MANES|nr:hypothetical protein MANES_18G017550v8 [Manihot esculenta]
MFRIDHGRNCKTYWTSPSSSNEKRKMLFRLETTEKSFFKDHDLVRTVLIVVALNGLAVISFPTKHFFCNILLISLSSLRDKKGSLQLRFSVRAINSFKCSTEVDIKTREG